MNAADLHISNLLIQKFCRLEWESAVLRGCTVFRQMEEERLEQLRGLGER